MENCPFTTDNYENIQIGIIESEALSLTMENFIYGWCEYFAYALHEEFGYEIFKMRDEFEKENGTYGDYGLIHAFCKCGNLFIDVRGITDNFSEFYEPFEDEGDIETIRIDPYTSSPWITEPNEFGTKLIEIAKKYILEHEEQYNVNCYFKANKKTKDIERG